MAELTWYLTVWHRFIMTTNGRQHQAKSIQRVTVVTSKAGMAATLNREQESLEKEYPDDVIVLHQVL